MNQVSHSVAPVSPLAGQAGSLMPARSITVPFKLVLVAAMAMIFAGSLPDAMVPPVLRQLLIERYGASASAAHWFMAVNLIGAGCAIPMLVMLRRFVTPAGILACAAAADGALLAAMAWPIGLEWTMTLRFVEGAADLMVFAILFDLVAKAGGPAARGRRLGAAGSLLLLGLAGGALVGGRIGAAEPTLIFCAGAAACLLVAIAACFAGPMFNGLVRSCPAVEIDPAPVPCATRRRRLWPAMAMTFSDRAIAGLLATTVPLYLATTIEVAPVKLGLMLGLPLFVMALGAWPAGSIADRFGHARVRAFAAVCYACLLAALPMLLAGGEQSIAMVMAGLGLAGCALMPTSMNLACAAGRGSVGLGAYHAAGNVGFLAGIIGAATLLATVGGAAPTGGAYAIVLAVFAIGHVAVTAVTSVALGRN